MKIKVFEITGLSALSKQNGEKLYNAIKDNTNKDNQLILDFIGVKIFSSPFFNASLGRLVNEIGADEYLEMIKVDNLSSNGKNILKTAMETSKDVKSSPEYQQKLARIIGMNGGDFNEH